MRENIFITGFSGAGKTTVSRDVARQMGWTYVDIDDEIVKAAGKPIDVIFRDDGEPRFREIERERLAAVAAKDRQVVSTGGGIVVDERNIEVMEQSGIVVCLEVRPETVLKRLMPSGRQRGPVVRPLLQGPDPLAKIRAMKAQRQVCYARAHWTVHTDRMSPSEVAQEVVRAWGLLSKQAQAKSAAGTGDLAAMVRTASGDYPVWVGWGILPELGKRVKSVFSPGVAFIVTDEGVRSHGRAAQASLEAAGVPSHVFIMPSGERNKNLDTVQHVYTWLAERKAERGHAVVAVGGGVVGDLAGFVAATYLRGMSFVQVPTSLLSMMDAAVGGKTAVDLPAGKNLVGAFKQPRLVLSDVAVLSTLPARELRAGWAEAIKHGLIMDESLLRTFETKAPAIQSLDRAVASEVIRRSAAIKANVVSQDEKETLGLRMLLNYGHTMGHAIEQVTGYERYLHGEAVSVGMMGAAMLSLGMGMLSQKDVDRQRAVLEAYGLPTSAPGLDVDAVRAAMSVDKKVAGGAIRWVLLDGIGRAVSRRDVPEALVRSTLEALCRP